MVMKRWFLVIALIVTVALVPHPQEAKAMTAQDLADQVATLGAGVGGVINLPAGGIAITEDTVLQSSKNQVTIIGQGQATKLWLSEGASIKVGYNVRLHSVNILKRGDEPALRVGVKDKMLSRTPLILWDVNIHRIPNDASGGIGLLLFAHAVKADASVATSSFGNIFIQGFETALKYKARESNGYNAFANGNMFQSLYLTRYRYGVVFDEKNGAYTGFNSFSNLELEPVLSFPNGFGIHLTANGQQIVNAVVWSPPSERSLIVDSNYNFVSGAFPEVINNRPEKNIIFNTME